MSGLWGGRFASGPADALAALSKSTHFDWRARAVRHAPARWRTPGCCTRPACSPTPSSPACSTRWTSSAPTSSRGAFTPAPDDEDVHTALERGLIDRAGPELGGKLRAGRSRNDQVATLYRMWLRDAARRIGLGVLDVVDALVAQADAHPEARRCPAAPTSSTPSPCCWPTTWPPTRRRCCATSTGLADWDRRTAVSPYGSGALAGSSLGLDPEAVAQELGFDARARPTRSTARPRGTSPPRSRSSAR